MKPCDVSDGWVRDFRAKLEEHAHRLGGPDNLHEAIRHALADVLSTVEPVIRERERAAVATRFDMARAISTETIDKECLKSAAEFVRTGLYLAAPKSR